MIYSASHIFENDQLGREVYHNSSRYPLKQGIFLVVSSLCALGVATTDYRRLASFYWLAFFLAIGLLILCALIGKEINGARSWIVFGPVSLQVSELCKLCYIICVAGYLRYRKNIESLHAFLLPLIPTALMLGFILRQPDFGTAMVFVPVFFSLMWCSGARLRYILIMILLGSSLLVGAYFQSKALPQAALLKPHQMGRIETYLATLSGEGLDRNGQGYHITMSIGAIGSGGAFGKGYGDGSLSQFGYLPERHTDFIFSVLAEEFGFFGVIAVFFLYSMLLLFCLGVGIRAKDPLGRMLALGVATMFFAQFTINVGMTCGVMPITGIPLPLLSYGGSSLMTSMLALGLVMSIHIHPSRSLGRE